MEFHSKQVSRPAYKAAMYLEYFYMKCGRFPTSEEGLRSLLTDANCVTKKLVDLKFDFKNGYGNELSYKSDGKKFNLVSKSIFGEVTIDETLILPIKPGAEKILNLKFDINRPRQNTRTEEFKNFK